MRGRSEEGAGSRVAPGPPHEPCWGPSRHPSGLTREVGAVPLASCGCRGMGPRGTWLLSTCRAMLY